MSTDGMIPTVQVPEDIYREDPNYDAANDAVDPDARGESDQAGTPGASGAPVGGAA